MTKNQTIDVRNMSKEEYDEALRQLKRDDFQRICDAANRAFEREMKAKYPDLNKE